MFGNVILVFSYGFFIGLDKDLFILMRGLIGMNLCNNIYISF